MGLIWVLYGSYVGIFGECIVPLSQQEQVAQSRIISEIAAFNSTKNQIEKRLDCLSIPVRVSNQGAHKWFNKAICEHFVFRLKPFCSLSVLYLRESLSSTVFRIFVSVEIQCVRYSFRDLCTRFLKHVAIHIARRLGICMA